MDSLETHSIGAAAAQARLPELLARVAAGDAITITEDGLPVARLVPVNCQQQATNRRDAIEGIKTLGRNLKLGDLRIVDMIHEGRR
jgi:prevent-host-death family protein